MSLHSSSHLGWLSLFKSPMSSTASSSEDGPSRKHMECSPSTVSPMLPSSFNGSWSEGVKICLGIELVVALSTPCSLWCAHLVPLKPLHSLFFLANRSRYAMKILSFSFLFGGGSRACLNLGKLSLMHQWLCCCRPRMCYRDYRFRQCQRELVVQEHNFQIQIYSTSEVQTKLSKHATLLDLLQSGCNSVAIKPFSHYHACPVFSQACSICNKWKNRCKQK